MSVGASHASGASSKGRQGGDLTYAAMRTREFNLVSILRDRGERWRSGPRGERRQRTRKLWRWTLEKKAKSERSESVELDRVRSYAMVMSSLGCGRQKKMGWGRGGCYASL